ncbi:MAG: hypothetical protein RRY22_04265, partial [Bacilli bacterium]
WEEVKPMEFGEYETLKLGGHEVVIKSAEVYIGQTGNKSLKVCVDIAGNDIQKGFYQKQYNDNNNSDKKWANGSTKYVTIKDEEKCVAIFKGFITAVENSNAGYKWNFEENTLVGKKICGVYGLEEYYNQNGDIGAATKLKDFRSLDKLADIKIPKVKLIDGTYIEYEEYLNRKKSYNNETITANNDIIDDLPFEL